MNTYQEYEHYEETSDLIRTSVEALENANIPVTVTGIHRDLEGRVSLSDIREIAPDMYGVIPETLVDCSGCIGHWCKTQEAMCVPDTLLFEQEGSN